MDPPIKTMTFSTFIAFSVDPCLNERILCQKLLSCFFEVSNSCALPSSTPKPQIATSSLKTSHLHEWKWIYHHIWRQFQKQKASHVDGILAAAISGPVLRARDVVQGMRDPLDQRPQEYLTWAMPCRDGMFTTPLSGVLVLIIAGHTSFDATVGRIIQHARS